MVATIIPVTSTKRVLERMKRASAMAGSDLSRPNRSGYQDQLKESVAQLILERELSFVTAGSAVPQGPYPWSWTVYSLQLVG